jgi:hypothetical protein
MYEENLIFCFIRVVYSTNTGISKILSFLCQIQSPSMMEALKRSSSTENFISQSSSSEECLHPLHLSHPLHPPLQQERLQFSLDSVGSNASSEEGQEFPGTGPLRDCK